MDTEKNHRELVLDLISKCNLKHLHLTVWKSLNVSSEEITKFEIRGTIGGFYYGQRTNDNPSD